MAHYAVLNENNIVINVITGREEDDLENLPENFNSWEQYYSERMGKRVLRTSYNTMYNSRLDGGVPFRGNYAGYGFFYSDELDVFIPPKPHDSWVFDDTIMDWEAPMPYPEGGELWIWNEEETCWIKADMETSIGQQESL